MAKQENIPKLRFGEFDESWRQVKLGEILSIGNGRDYKHLKPGNVPVYGTGGYMLSVDKALYTGETVFIGRKGTIDKPFYFNGAFWTVDTLFYTKDFKGVIPKFTFSVFQNINWKIYNEATGVPSLSKGTIEKINVAIPNTQEQQKIAAFLSSVDKKIALLTEKKAKLSEYKKGVMQQLFNGTFVKQESDGNTVFIPPTLRFKADNGSEFPDWEEKSLSLVSSITMGTSPSSSAYNEEGIGLPLLQGNADINNRLSAPRIFTNEITKECHCGDILLSVRAPVGTVAKSQHNACIGRGIAAIKALRNHYQEFIYQLMMYFEPRWDSLSQGSTFEAVNSKDIKGFILKVPSYNEQIKIANFLSLIDKKIELANTELKKAQQWKKGLLQQMFV